MYACIDRVEFESSEGGSYVNRFQVQDLKVFELAVI
jgi:hypothetical protein